MHTRVNHKFLFALIFILITLTNASALFAESATLSWSPPSENADGTTLSDLAGYIISYGTEAGNYTRSIDVGNVTSYEVQGLTSDQTYYFAVTAYDQNGNESDYSIEESKYIEDTTPVTYFCDSDSDGSMNSLADGVCTGTGCEPAGCVTNPGNDCNDNNSGVNPGASDSNCNGIDENCDGTPDNNYVIAISSCGTGVCSSLGQISCTDGSEVDSCSPGIPDEQAETSAGDGLDNDCDGLVDEGKSAEVDISRVIMAEDFSEGIPVFWTTEGSWNTENSCGQVVDQPFAGPYVISDSSCIEEDISNLVTSPFDTTGCDTATLSFSNQYYWYSGSMEVDISTDGGKNWSNHLYTESNNNYPTPAWKEINLGTVTGSENTLVNFKYSNDSTAGFWAIDNLWITCKASSLDFSSHINMPSSPESILISNTGSDGLSIDAIEIDGPDSFDFDLDLEECLYKTLLPGESCMIDIVFTPGSEGSKNAGILIITNDPANRTSSILLTGTASSAIPPLPVIRVNGIEGPANIKSGSQVALTVHLDPKSYVNEDGDWWILMEYKNRWHYYGAQSGKWRRGNRLYQQGPFEIPGSVEVLSTSSLRKGVYTFYFGIDTHMNGLQDLNNYYFDSITVNIE